ncbi:hypothetical protein BDR04DRAFT_1131083 [Suillus decipiens]|nr:hypothetical protein BDR04DRAFT_1131083 [Suillus decipiens]
MSCGIISMACLNLPSDIRYKLENMYLAGIIPSPKQLCLENLNHYIRPLINDLVDAWDCGIKVSKTTCYPNISSHFYCSACKCHHKSTYGRVDCENWEPYDRNELRKYTEQWRDAATTSEHEKLFKAHDVHYSKLWHLTYWDPSRQLIIHSMHCLLEGLVPYHICNPLSLTSHTSLDNVVQGDDTNIHDSCPACFPDCFKEWTTG